MADLQGLMSGDYYYPWASNCTCPLGLCSWPNSCFSPRNQNISAERTKRHDDVHDSIAWAIFEHVSDTQCVKEKTSQMSIKSGYIIAISSLCTIICCLLHLLSGSRHFYSVTHLDNICQWAWGGVGEGGRKGGDWTGRLIYFPPFQVHSLFFKLTVSVSSSISKELMNSRRSLLVLPSHVLCDPA